MTDPFAEYLRKYGRAPAEATAVDARLPHVPGARGVPELGVAGQLLEGARQAIEPLIAPRAARVPRAAFGTAEQVAQGLGRTLADPATLIGFAAGGGAGTQIARRVLPEGMAALGEMAASRGLLGRVVGAAGTGLARGPLGFAGAEGLAALEQGASPVEAYGGALQGGMAGLLGGPALEAGMASLAAPAAVVRGLRDMGERGGAGRAPTRPAAPRTPVTPPPPLTPAETSIMRRLVESYGLRPEEAVREARKIAWVRGARGRVEEVVARAPAQPEVDAMLTEGRAIQAAREAAPVPEGPLAVPGMLRPGEAGGANPAVLRSVAGAGVGAGVGAAVSPEDRVKGAVAGGLIGLLAPLVGTKEGRAAFRSRGNLPQDMFGLKLGRDFGQQDFQLSIREAEADFRRAASQVYGRLRRVPEADLVVMDDILKGERPVTDAHPAFQPVLERTRRDIDAATRRGITSGAIPEATEANLGRYATRSYRIYDDPTWVARIPEEVKNRVRTLLESEMEGAAPAEVEGMLNLLLDKNMDGPLVALRGGKLGAKDLSILTRRKDIAPEIRELWGEYRDPRVNYARSMERMANLITNHEFLTEARQVGMGRIFHEKPTVGPDGVSYHRQIAAEGSDAMAPLNGLYTTPEIAEAFSETFNNPAIAWWGRAYYALNGAVSLSKTVLSPVTQLRNLTGNALLQLANGNVNPLRSPQAIRATWQGLLSGGDPAWRAYYRKLVNLGVVGESANMGELRAILKDVGVGENVLTGSPVARGAAHVSTGAQHLYRAGDDVWKVFAFESELAKYRKALPGVPEAELEARVATIVRNTMPTYSLVPKAIKGLRRFPAVGQFVSWPAEIYRTLYHTLKLTKAELADPALRGIGARRLAGLAAAATIVPATVRVSRMLTGVSKQDEDDLRPLLPDYQRNSNLVFTGRGNGTFSVVDLSYTDPYSAIRDPVMALLRGEADEAFAEGLRPFFSEKILTGAVLDVARNRTRDGRQVVNPEASWTAQKMGQLGHLGLAVEPGAVTTGRRLMRSAEGAPGAATLPDELRATFTGQRVKRIDLRYELSRRTRDYLRRASDARGMLNQALAQRGTPSADELTSAYEAANEAGARLHQAFAEDVQRMRRLDLPDTEIRRILRTSGMSRRAVGEAMSGTYRPIRPGQTFLRDWGRRQRAIGADSASVVGEQQRRRAILQSAPTGDDPYAAYLRQYGPQP